jgi:predicted dehydrogenase
MRLVQVGVRGMGSHWVNVARRSTEVEVVGYVDVVPAHLEALQREHGVPPSACFLDLEQALRTLRPDGVLCITPPQFHRDVAVAALRAGCHVLTEKPLADTWERCLEMVAEARRAGRVLMVAQNYRYSRPVQTLRRVIAGGTLGRPGQVAVEFYKGPHFGGFRDEMPYPLVIDMSIHHFDMMRFLLAADPVVLWARSWNPRWSWYKGDASATVFLEMRPRDDPSRTVPVTYTGSWCAQGGATPWNGEWRVLCEEGSVLLRDDRVLIQRREGQPWEEVPLVPLERSGQDWLLHEFVSAVREGRQPETSGEDNLRSIEMVFRTLDSIRTGQLVELGRS